MSSDPIRAALERLVSAYGSCQGHYEEVWPQYLDGPMAAARAALAAEPVEEGPSRADICQWLEQQGHWGDSAHRIPRVANMVQSALARWGRPATPPAPEPGEVGGLVEELNQIAGSLNDDGFFHSCDQLWRAATLLGQLSALAPVVVPVAIPGEQWHEDDGTCLWWRFEIDEAPWVGDPRDSDWPGYHTHFTRIVCPLPQAGEGES